MTPSIEIGSKHKNPKTGLVVVIVGFSRDSEDGTARVLYKWADGSEDDLPPWDRSIELFLERFRPLESA